MAKNSEHRRLAKVRARTRRQPVMPQPPRLDPGDGLAHFECPTCGCEWDAQVPTLRVQIQAATHVGGPGQPLSGGTVEAGAEMDCPAGCGTPVSATNARPYTDSGDFNYALFASSEDELNRLTAMLEFLRSEAATGLSPEQLALEVERLSPRHLGVALTKWIKKHGVTATLLLGALAWVFPDPLGIDDSEPPPPPVVRVDSPAIDRALLQDLVAELRRANELREQEQRDRQERKQPGAKKRGQHDEEGQ